MRGTGHNTHQRKIRSDYILPSFLEEEETIGDHNETKDMKKS